MKKICDEIFGEENFLACIAWEKRYTRSNNAKRFYSLKDSILCYRKSDALEYVKEARNEKSDSNYSNPDNDIRGDWTTSSYINPATKEQRPNLAYEITRPLNGEQVTHPTHAWKYSINEHLKHVDEKRLWWGKDGTAQYPRLKLFLSEQTDGLVPIDLWSYKDAGTTDEGGSEIKALFDKVVFDTPKPKKLINKMLSIATNNESNDIVLDFFSGSGTTGHAVIEKNTEDNGNRKFILVQLPEILSEENRDQKVAADFCDSILKPKTIAELTKERLRRAGKKVREDNPDWNGDVGFRVFKLDTSNIRPWEATAETLSEQIDAYVSPILEGRSEEDLLTELMLKRGIDLSVNIETRQFDGLTVSCVDGGKLFTCFTRQIPASSVEELTKGIIDWHKSLKAGKDTVCYFLDDAFENNVAKTNLCAILEQHGLTNLHSL